MKITNKNGDLEILKGSSSESSGRRNHMNSVEMGKYIRFFLVFIVISSHHFCSTLEKKLRHGEFIGNPSIESVREIKYPLHLAVQGGSIENVKVMISYIFDKNSKNERGETALHIATRNRDFNIVSFLLEQKALIDVQNENFQTPLHIATIEHSQHMVELLLSKNAQATIADSRGNLPLHEICREKLVYEYGLYRYQIAIFKALIKAYPEAGKAKNVHGLTPLFFAIRSENLEFIEELMKLGSDPFLTDDEKMISLHHAAKTGNTSVLEKVLRQTSKVVNDQDSKGNTALHYSVKIGSTPSVKLLLKEFKADPNIVNIAGHLPIYLAKKEGFSAIEKLLEESKSHEQPGLKMIWDKVESSKMTPYAGKRVCENKGMRLPTYHEFAKVNNSKEGFFLAGTEENDKPFIDKSLSFRDSTVFSAYSFINSKTSSADPELKYFIQCVKYELIAKEKPSEPNKQEEKNIPISQKIEIVKDELKKIDTTKFTDKEKDKLKEVDKELSELENIKTKKEMKIKWKEILSVLADLLPPPNNAVIKLMIAFMEDDC